MILATRVGAVAALALAGVGIAASPSSGAPPEPSDVATTPSSTPSPPPAPRPPRPPPPHPLVQPEVLEALRLAGNPRIAPDAATRRRFRAAGKTRIVALAVLCIDRRGRVESVVLTLSSGVVAYDNKLRRKMRAWRFRPYLDNGAPAPVCTRIPFAFSTSA